MRAVDPGFGKGVTIRRKSYNARKAGAAERLGFILSSLNSKFVLVITAHGTWQRVLF